MTGATRDVSHGHVPRAGADRYAVVSGADGAMDDSNEIRVPDMDTVGVRAVIRGRKCQILHGDIVAPIYKNVDCFTVERFQAANCNILATLERQ